MVISHKYVCWETNNVSSTAIFASALIAELLAPWFQIFKLINMCIFLCKLTITYFCFLSKDE